MPHLSMQTITAAGQRIPVDPPVPSAAGRSAGLAGRVVFAVAIFLLALLPRNVGLETFVTTDEIFWVGRSGGFARALARGRLELTFQTGHPGVTTMWAGLLGIGPERAQRLGNDRREVSRSQVSRHPEFLVGLAAGRRVVALTTALAVAAVALLAWRLLGLGPALLGGALLALDPFLLAHSQVLHIDALLSCFMAVALLAGLARWLAGGGRGYLVVSGIATGLALLSKSPALFLLGFLPPIALLAAWRPRRPVRRGAWLDLAAWLGLALATYVALWPALWSAPLETLRGLLGFVLDNANPRHATPAEGGTDGGVLFYPIAFLLRTTPLVLIGLTLLALEAILALRRQGPRTKEHSSLITHHSSLALAAYVVLFGLAMAVTAKSFDRYLLPAFPALDLLAGLGLALAARRLRPFGGAGLLLAGTFVLPLLAYPTATSLPYALTWYNPLAGGGPAAQRALAVGWGEGLDLVARYLNARPDATQLRVVMPGEIYTAVLGSQFAGQVMPAEGGDPAANDSDYFVTYVRTPQDGEPPVYDPRFQTWPAEVIARLGGVEYAHVYRAELGVPLGASFGPLATLEGYGLNPPTARAGRTVSVRLFWRERSDAASAARAVLTLRDASGRELARAAGSLGAPDPARPRSRTYELPLPAGLAPGEYLLWVGLETDTGQVVSLEARPAALAPGAPEHPERAVLRSIRVRSPGP